MSNPALDRVPHRQVIALLVDAAAESGYDEVPDNWWPDGFNDDDYESCRCMEHRTTCADHDTTDPFCGSCGKGLHTPEHCDECASGDHIGEGTPFCPCCGHQFNPT